MGAFCRATPKSLQIWHAVEDLVSTDEKQLLSNPEAKIQILERFFGGFSTNRTRNIAVFSSIAAGSDPKLDSKLHETCRKQRETQEESLNFITNKKL